jgi:predicted nucleotidyltransferase
MIEALRAVLESNPLVSYALLFGSAARGGTHPHSDVDIAIGTQVGHDPTLEELGALGAALEKAARTQVDVVLLHEAPPGLAYRIFRDGSVVTARDRAALTARRARAILDYLDFRPIEDLCTKGVLAATHGR